MAGCRNRRSVHYARLPAGDHLFRVVARNSDGVVSTSESTVAITVIPPFYRRWWFFAAIAAASLASVPLLWRYRVGQFMQRQAAQQAFSQQLIASQEHERRRIAAELHDSLGQRLIVINNLARLLLRPQSRSGSEADRSQTIEEISGEAAAAIEETRAISYALRPFQLDRLGLSKAIESLLRTETRASSIEFTFDITNIDDVFREDVRVNFFRLVQEGVNNIVKHSHASRGEVVVLRTPRSVTLTIGDDGTGMAPGTAAGTGGFGLTGLGERAALLGGTFAIRSEAGHGTTLTFEFTVEEAHG